MKKIIYSGVYFYMFFLIITTLGCKKQPEVTESKEANRKSVSNRSEIIGTWVNTIEKRDTIIIHDSTMKRWDISSGDFFHFYNYTIKPDSIILNYTGLYKIGTPPFHRRIYINNDNDSLIIQCLNSVYPCYKGDLFIKVLK